MDPGLRSGVTGKILDALADGKPMTAAELTARIGHVEDRKHDNWGWNWNAVKRVLEHLFEEGVVSSASRTEQFERRYALTAQGPARPRRCDSGAGSVGGHGQAHRRGRPGARNRHRAVLRGLLPDADQGGSATRSSIWWTADGWSR